MRSLFIIDPLDGLDEAADSSIALMRETAKRGGTVDVCEARQLALNELGVAEAEALRIELREGRDWYRPQGVQTRSLAEYDVAWMRKDPPFDADYFQATLLLSHAERQTLMVNSAAALRDVNEKLFALRYPELCPDTIVTSSVEKLAAFQEKSGGAMVVKPLDEAAGRGVVLVEAGSREKLLAATGQGTRFVIGQRYLPEVRDGDKRIILVEGRPAGALLRIPREGEFRANLHAGARAERTTITERDAAICEAIGPELRRRGVVFAGIDVIGEYLTEINITSPTCLREIHALDGVSLEAEIVDAVEQRLGSSS